MKDFFSEYGAQIMSYVFTVLAAFVSFLVVFFNSKKAKYEYKEQLAKKETENLALQKAIIEGAYVICPSCGSKIFLKDAKVYTQEVKNEEV